jgi:hypothetical protein
MANQIKSSGAAGAALQVTKPARAAGLVEEDEEGETTYLSEVRVFAFEYPLLRITPCDLRSDYYDTSLERLPTNIQERLLW